MIDLDQLLLDLNEPQQTAVKHTGGPLLILAGAGSGKTRTITYKIAYLIAKGITRPEQILAVTFTNKAAAEMRSRVEQLLGSVPSLPLVCTFHSLGVRLLRRHAECIGFRPDFTICDTDDQKRVVKRLFKDFGFDDEVISTDTARRLISHAKNKGWSPEEYLNQNRDSAGEVVYEVFKAYRDTLQRLNSMDFDDLILMTVKVLKENPDIRERYGTWYEYLLIDEYQDTNAPQFDLVRQLTAHHENISAVGDEDQSIYGFRGADISNILRFEKDFSGARVIKLEQNYRSTQKILEAATAVVSNNVNRKKKVLWTKASGGDPIRILAAQDAREEANYIAQKTREHLLSGASSVAVLYRTNFQSRQFEEIFRRNNINYRLVGGVSFYQRKEIKDAVAYLRSAVNPDDDISLTRILNEPPRGIGDVTRNRILDLAREHSLTFWQALCFALEENLFPGRAHLKLEQFKLLIERCRSVLDQPLYLALEQILDRSGYIRALSDGSEDNTSRIQNLHELVNVAKETGTGENPIQEFLDQVALHADIDDFDEDAEVTLMTLHNAKGLEFPVVFLAGCEEGLFPHSRSIAENDLEEERRLCYVGLTRAQQKLYLTFSRRRRFFGRESEELNRPSRFLQEIPQDLVEEVSLYPAFGSASPGFRGAVELGSESLFAPQKPSRPYPGKTFNTVDSVQKALKQWPAAKKTASGFRAGSFVLHRKFGRGKVLSVEPSGSDLKITVQFPGKGIKKMLQSYAKLQLA
ncbi:MAG: UvrD-helicase domain-containing protein [Acidobacteriota bacterium]|nr:MAG: UvrD-helicase domain-containing protein [Acidobacteriota bacterium]